MKAFPPSEGAAAAHAHTNPQLKFGAPNSEFLKDRSPAHTGMLFYSLSPQEHRDPSSLLSMRDISAKPHTHRLRIFTVARRNTAPMNVLENAPRTRVPTKENSRHHTKSLSAQYSPEFKSTCDSYCMYLGILNSCEQKMSSKFRFVCRQTVYT
jgi:hypothetical protein